MPKIGKAALLFLITLATPLLLCGCLKFNMHLTINRNRTADLEITLTAPKTLLALDPELEQKLFKDKQEELAEQGFSISDPEDEQRAGFIAAKRLKSVEDFAELEITGDLGLHDREIFTVEKSALTTTYHLDADLDLQDIIGEESGSSALLLSDLNFILTLPVKPLEHNADAVTEDGRTLVWKLSPTKVNRLQLTARAPNLSAVLIGIAAFVLLIASVTTFLIYRSRVKQARPSVKKRAGEKKR